MELARPAAPGLSEAPGDPQAVDLRDAGLTSIAAVRLMLEIEAAFDIAIPDGELTPENFASSPASGGWSPRLKSVARLDAAPRRSTAQRSAFSTR